MREHTIDSINSKAKSIESTQIPTSSAIESIKAVDSIAQSTQSPNPTIDSTKATNTIESAIDSMPDIVFFGMRFEPRTWKRVSPPVITQPLCEEEILYEVFAHCATPPWHIWAKLYKASHIARVIDLLVAHMGADTRLTMAEDVLKSFWICALAHSSVGIRDKLYVYCDSHSSITRKIDTATRDKKIADISRVIEQLDSLSSVAALRANRSFTPAQTRAINILKSVRELEYRYDTINGGGDTHILPPYLRACLRSLGYHRKWQSFVRIALYLLSLGRLKL